MGGSACVCARRSRFVALSQTGEHLDDLVVSSTDLSRTSKAYYEAGKVRARAQTHSCTGARPLCACACAEGESVLYRYVKQYLQVCSCLFKEPHSACPQSCNANSCPHGGCAKFAILDAPAGCGRRLVLYHHELITPPYDYFRTGLSGGPCVLTYALVASRRRRGRAARRAAEHSRRAVPPLCGGARES